MRFGIFGLFWLGRRRAGDVGAASARGWMPDGQIALGQVAFLPSAVRVAAPGTGTGAAVTLGTPVLTATSTTVVVYVALPVSEQSAVRVGQPVTITLPSGAVTTGRVQGPAGPAAPGSSGSAGGSGGSGAQEALRVRGVRGAVDGQRRGDL